MVRSKFRIPRVARTTLFRDFQRQNPQGYVLSVFVQQGQASIMMYLLPTSDEAHAVQLGQPSWLKEARTCGLLSYMTNIPQHSRHIEGGRNVKIFSLFICLKSFSLHTFITYLSFYIPRYEITFSDLLPVHIPWNHFPLPPLSTAIPCFFSADVCVLWLPIWSGLSTAMQSHLFHPFRL